MKNLPRLLRLPALALVAAALSLAARAAVHIEPTETGLLIQNGEQLKLTFSYPRLMSADSKEVVKIVERRLSPRGAELIYEQGARATIEIDGGLIECRFADVPADVKLVGSSAQIPFSFATGGRWQAGGGEPQPFPESQPAKAHLYQGGGNEFAIHDLAGKVLRFTIPDYSYIQFTDNREWNWKIFTVRHHSPYNRDNPVIRIRVSDTASR